VWYTAIIIEISEGRTYSSRGRSVPRGVKQKMSGYALRPRAPCETKPRDVRVLVKPKIAEIVN
jgi:hypothetical protein